MLVPTRIVNRAVRQEQAMLHGPTSQLVWLEHITRSGGALNQSHNKMVGATETKNVIQDVPAIIGGPDGRMRHREDDDLSASLLNIDQEAVWYFANDRQLSTFTNLVIVQFLKDKLYSGAGTGSSTIWTPGTNPAWTDDEWIDYWLLLGTDRFRVTDNDGTTVTVDLSGGTADPGDVALPTSSTSGEMVRAIEWFPIVTDIGGPLGQIAPLGRESVLQPIHCSRIARVG